ncbi:MAG: hypothetical protein AAB874_01935 [Patescibacteria group bacterium]
MKKFLTTVCLVFLLGLGLSFGGCASAPTTKGLEKSVAVATMSSDILAKAPDNTTSLQYAIITNGTDTLGNEFWDISKFMVTKVDGKVTECKYLGNFSTSDQGFVKAMMNGVAPALANGVGAAAILSPVGGNGGGNDITVQGSNANATATLH